MIHIHVSSSSSIPWCYLIRTFGTLSFGKSTDLFYPAGILIEYCLSEFESSTEQKIRVSSMPSSTFYLLQLHRSQLLYHSFCFFSGCFFIVLGMDYSEFLWLGLQQLVESFFYAASYKFLSSLSITASFSCTIFFRHGLLSPFRMLCRHLILP